VIKDRAVYLVPRSSINANALESEKVTSSQVFDWLHALLFVIYFLVFDIVLIRWTLLNIKEHSLWDKI
jgi:hypothetical protein